jgi:hypothetical protein
MNTLLGKLEQRDRNDFRVKFTGADRKHTAPNGKEMILGERPRTVRDFNSFCTRGILKSEEESIEEDSNNSSKRELKP